MSPTVTPKSLDDDEFAAEIEQVLVAQVRSLPPLSVTSADIANRTLLTAVDREPQTDSHRWARTAFLAAAAVVLTLVGGLALLSLTRTSETIDAAVPDPTAEIDPPAETGPSDEADALPSPPLVFVTPTVEATAGTVEVAVVGRTFSPPLDGTLDVNGDPGDSNYTTLELTWFEDDTEMRINIYFTGDADSWWSPEIRVYNGEVPGEWITLPGEFFRSPRGQAFEGDLEVGPLTMTDLRLEAFHEPEVCRGNTSGLELMPLYRTITMPADAEGFGFGARLIDTAGCAIMHPGDLEVVASTADPAVATVGHHEILPDGDLRWDVTSVGPGRTTLTVDIIDPDRGTVAYLTVPVEVKAER